MRLGGFIWYIFLYDPVFTKKEEITFGNSRIKLKQVKDPLPSHWEKRAI